jgi:class 3 adenylate cyclase
MTFEDIVDQAIAMVRRRGRVTYRMLKRQFTLDDEALEDLKEELLYSQPQISDDAGRGLVWTGDAAPTESDSQCRAVAESRFQSLLRAAIAILQRERRATSRTLKHVLGIDEALLHEIREELALRQLAVAEAGKVLVWTAEAQAAVTPGVAAPGQPATAAVAPVTPPARASLPPPATAADTPWHGPTRLTEPGSLAALHDEPVVTSEPIHSAPEAERRQLTVMFCDLADSTKLAGQLDPEDLREVVRAYQATAADVIQQYEGHMAQYLGDGLLIYFGWPRAHEDDAQRALHSGLGIIEAITTTLNPRLEREKGVQLTVRLGVHTGPVVVGEMGGGGRQENLATGETVNIAAHLEGLAASNTMVISNVTARLVQGAFVTEDLGTPPSAFRKPAVARLLPQQTPEVPGSPILRRLSRPRKAAPHLAARCYGVLPTGAGGAAGVASRQRPLARSPRMRQGCFSGLRSRRAGDKMALFYLSSFTYPPSCATFS